MALLGFVALFTGLALLAALSLMGLLALTGSREPTRSPKAVADRCSKPR